MSISNPALPVNRGSGKKALRTDSPSTLPVARSLGPFWPPLASQRACRSEDRGTNVQALTLTAPRTRPRSLVQSEGSGETASEPPLIAQGRTFEPRRGGIRAPPVGCLGAENPVVLDPTGGGSPGASSFGDRASRVGKGRPEHYGEDLTVRGPAVKGYNAGVFLGLRRPYAPTGGVQ